MTDLSFKQLAVREGMVISKLMRGAFLSQANNDG
jgi:hypothetical protein